MQATTDATMGRVVMSCHVSPSTDLSLASLGLISVSARHDTSEGIDTSATCCAHLDWWILLLLRQVCRLGVDDATALIG